MTDHEILQCALAARASAGLDAMIEILVTRFPSDRYKQKFQLHPGRGPWGRIIALAPEGTLVEFGAGKLISYLGGSTAAPTRQKLSRKNRVRIFPVVSQATVELLNALSTQLEENISTVIENALADYAKRLPSPTQAALVPNKIIDFKTKLKEKLCN